MTRKNRSCKRYSVQANKIAVTREYINISAKILIYIQPAVSPIQEGSTPSRCPFPSSHFFPRSCSFQPQGPCQPPGLPSPAGFKWMSVVSLKKLANPGALLTCLWPSPHAPSPRACRNFQARCHCPSLTHQHFNMLSVSLCTSTTLTSNFEYHFPLLPDVLQIAGHFGTTTECFWLRAPALITADRHRTVDLQHRPPLFRHVLLAVHNNRAAAVHRRLKLLRQLSSLSASTAQRTFIIVSGCFAKCLSLSTSMKL